MNKKLLIIVIVIVVLILGTMFFLNNNQSLAPAEPSSSIEQAALKSNPELERKYEQQLKDILEPFWVSNDPMGIKEQILELRAPGKYLELHFNIVLAFDMIEQGSQMSDQSKIEEALAKLYQLKSQYKWLD